MAFGVWRLGFGQIGTVFDKIWLALFGAFGNIHCKFMAHHRVHRKRPRLSDHQKQIRFWTIASVCISVLATLAILWIINKRR